MKLERGITGLCGMNEKIPSSDVYAFRALLYTVEHGKRYKILPTEEKFHTRNYTRFTITDKRDTITFDILVNNYYPYYCGVNCETIDEFVEIPEDVINCIGNNFIYLSLATLKVSPHQADLSELSEEELKEIRFWRPRNIGEIIFNMYD